MIAEWLSYAEYGSFSSKITKKIQKFSKKVLTKFKKSDIL